jgi:hypothetical protein
MPATKMQAKKESKIILAIVLSIFSPTVQGVCGAASFAASDTTPLLAPVFGGGFRSSIIAKAFLPKNTKPTTTNEKSLSNKYESDLFPCTKWYKAMPTLSKHRKVHKIIGDRFIYRSLANNRSAPDFPS